VSQSIEWQWLVCRVSSAAWLAYYQSGQVVHRVCVNRAGEGTMDQSHTAVCR